MIRIRTMLLLFLALLGASAQESPQLDVELSPPKAHLGDPVTLKIRVRTPPGWTINQEQRPSEHGEATILSQTWHKPNQAAAQTGQVATLELKLAFYELGEKTAAPVDLQIFDPQGQPQIFSTPELQLEITPLLSENDQELAPMKDQVKIHIPTWMWVVLAVIAALLLGLIAFLIRHLMRRRKREIAAKPEPPPPPPYDEAMARLRDLTGGGLLKEGQFKPFYVAINGIIRHYYARIFGINAEEMTSWELEDFLAAAKSVDGAIVHINKNFQELCDQVKFAKYDPIESEHNDVVNWAYKLVEALKPLAAITPEQEASRVAVG